MPISFNCPHCGTFTQVGDQYAGQSGPCKSCGNTVAIPFATAPAGKAPIPRSSSTGSVVLIVVLIAVFGVVTVGGVLVALLLPAVQAAREAARRMQCSNNIKQISIAMHNYHDSYNAFPPAYTVDENGNKLHSWRTLLLPFLEQDSLYNQIDLSKPWDAPENRSIVDVSLPVFGCASDPESGSNGTRSTNTSYMVIVGPGTIFEDDQQRRIADIPDGTANTILVVETKGMETHWADPKDLSIEGMQAQINASASGLGSHHPGGVQVGLADGSVRFVAETIDPEVLKAMITRDGGEMVPVNY